MRRLPPVTTVVVIAAALAMALPAALELDRTLPTQPWRLLTGHLAHYSPYHFAVDAGALLLLGLLCERVLGSRAWAGMLLASAGAVSVGFLVLEPHRVYRGLSGLDCAAFAAALVVEWRRRRVVAAVLGAALAAKLLYETWAGAFILPATGLGDMGAAVLSAHWIGALVGLACAWVALREPFGAAAVEATRPPSHATPPGGVLWIPPCSSSDSATPRCR